MSNIKEKAAAEAHAKRVNRNAVTQFTILPTGMGGSSGRYTNAGQNQIRQANKPGPADKRNSKKGRNK